MLIGNRLAHARLLGQIAEGQSIGTLFPNDAKRRVQKLIYASVPSAFSLLKTSAIRAFDSQIARASEIPGLHGPCFVTISNLLLVAAQGASRIRPLAYAPVVQSQEGVEVMSSLSITRPVLIIGGSGIVGAKAAQTLRQLHPELPIAIGGRDVTKAMSVAGALGNAVAVKIDFGPN